MAGCGDVTAAVPAHGLSQALPEDERYSLAELGLSLVPSGSPDLDESQRAATVAALAEVEAALGIAGSEASQELFATPGQRPSGPADVVAEPFAAAHLRALLDAPYGEVRNQLRAVLSRPEMAYQSGLPRPEYRDLVLTWTEQLADEGLGAIGFPEAFGGKDDFGAFIAAFETLAMHDTSLVVKFGVQFGLFGGSVYFLGTEPHHRRYLRDIGSLALPGCFAMTELGHGSNVWDIETVAEFDRIRQEFVITTPVETARKEWIGNAALHGRLATVFAQLRVDGEAHGVHAFLVPLRSETGSLMEGIRIEDCGEKQGLNGVDNGRIWFDGVRVPRDQLLNRYGDVDESGRYQSPIPSPFRRFFTMLGTLVGGRISVAGAGVTAAKVGLTIAVRYTAIRRQFGPAGAREIPVLDYLSVQRRLMPRLAATYALDATLKYVVRRFLDRTEEDAREVEALAAGVKAYATWNTIDTLQACRECCGGQGFLAVNRISALKADTDIFATFEGDNSVLMQLVAKALLTDYKDQFGEMRFWGIVKIIAERAATAVTQRNPIVTRSTDEEHLRDPEFHLDAARYREQRLLQTVAARLKARIDDGIDTFLAFNQCQDHLVKLAEAHVERIVFEQMHEWTAACPDEHLRGVLATVRDLFVLWRLEQDRAWFLENGYFEPGKSKAIRSLVNRLCGEVRGLALPLVEAFGIPDACVGAPIASSIDPRSESTSET